MATSMRLLRSEIHPDYTRIEEIINIFVSLGFTRFSIHDETDVYIFLSLTVLEDKIPFKPFVLAALEGIYISF